MKKIIYVFAAFTALCLSSCGNELSEVSPSVEKATLKVKTDIAATKAVISDFPSNSQLGMFITNGSLGSNYESQATNVNVQATGTGSSWTLAPAVYLSNKSATIFAYYPYNSAATDGTAVAVTSDQTDFMYGTHTTGQLAINNDNSTVLLTMNHALSLLSFKFSKTNYPGAGVVSKIEVANASGKTLLFSSGKLNINTGAITGTVGQNSPTSIANASGLITLPSVASTDEGTYPKVMVLPTAATAAAGDLVFNFTIDGKVYSWNVPAATSWAKGTKNIYTVALSGTGLTVGTVVIAPWTTGTTGTANLQ